MQLNAKKKVVLKDLKVWKKYKWIVTGKMDFWTFIAFWDNLEFNWLAYQKFSDDNEVDVIVDYYEIDEYAWKVKVSLTIID